MPPRPATDGGRREAFHEQIRQPPPLSRPFRRRRRQRRRGHRRRPPRAGIRARHPAAPVAVVAFHPGRRHSLRGPGHGVRQAGGRRGQDRAHQPERPAGAGDGVDPERRGAGHHHPGEQSRAPLRNVARRRERRGRGDRRQAGRLVRLREGQLRGRRPLDRRAAVHHLVGDHVSRGLVQGSRVRVPEDVGRLPQGRPRPEGQRQAVRAGVRSQHQRPEQLVLSAAVDVGRHGGAGGRPRRSCSTARTHSTR